MSDPMDDAVTLPQSFIDEMIAHAQSDKPSECCGVIARFPDGSFKLFRATNEEASPYRFTIPPRELLYLYNAIDGREGQMYVIYHSHTKTEGRPSPTDLNFARLLRGPDPWPYWVLVSLEHEEPSVRAWRIDNEAAVNEVTAVEIPLRAGAELAGSARVRLRSTVTESPIE